MSAAEGRRLVVTSSLGTGARHAGREPDDAPAYPEYWRFYDAVAARQVGEWLPAEPSIVLDLSRADARYAVLAGQAGHHVVIADAFDLTWLRDESVDAILAENGALSEHLAAEHTFAQLQRVLKPGGRLLICVESLVLGLARLAEQHRWAELADVPSADVVLVENEDGSITRCFWPEELEGVLADFGYDVEWVRPRTVLSQDAVSRALTDNPAAFHTLVDTEVALAEDRQGESTGIHLVASARRR